MRLIFDHVNYIYDKRSAGQSPALSDVSFELEQGSLLAVIGRSGSGKSTLALLLAGLYQPCSSNIHIEHDKYSSGDFGSVGMVFQYPEMQLFGETVFEEVSFGAKNHGFPSDYLPHKVRQALETVGLDADELWGRSPFRLSGGQKRRVCIASVLAMDTPTIIFDEPCAGMDDSGRQWMMQLAKDLRDKGKTIVWITHDMSEAAELADRILVLDQGRLLMEGTPQQVFAQEDLLYSVGLELPPPLSLLRELKSHGAAVPAQAFDVDGACAEILAWLQGKSEQEETFPVFDFAGNPPDTLSEDERWEMQTQKRLQYMVTAMKDGMSMPEDLFFELADAAAMIDDLEEEKENFAKDTPDFFVEEWWGGGKLV